MKLSQSIRKILKKTGMTTSIAENPKAISVRIEAIRFYVVLNDGREIGIPYTWFPRLAAATPAERANWRLIGKGTGIHWEAVDEDLSVRALLYPVAGPVEQGVGV